MVNMPAKGSTAPENIPQPKALLVLMPADFKGMETMAPSGKF